MRLFVLLDDIFDGLFYESGSLILLFLILLLLFELNWVDFGERRFEFIELILIDLEKRIFNAIDLLIKAVFLPQAELLIAQRYETFLFIILAIEVQANIVVDLRNTVSLVLRHDINESFGDVFILLGHLLDLLP